MYSRLVEVSLRNPVIVVALALILLAVGIFQTQQLPVDVLPDLTRPMVTVQAETAGLAPEDVESQVTFPLETALSGLQGVSRIRSLSSPGLSVVYAEFEWGTDPFRNRQLVAERVDSIRSQLAAIADPRIGPLTSLMGEIYLVALQAVPATSNPQQVREHADWSLRPKLLSLPGVAQVVVIGGEVKQYEIRPDLEKLKLHGVTLAQITEATSGFGNNTGASFADANGAEFAIRSLGRPLNLEDLAQTAVAWRGTGALRLGQVADVAVGAKLKRGDAGMNGQPAVILAIQKQPGTDTLQLTHAIEHALAESDVHLPKGTHRTTLFRQADFIDESVANVSEALLEGALVVALILFLFIASARITLVALLAIPLSVLAAILVLHGFGFTINTMTLGGLAIAVGELVDDAVVGIENVVRRLRRNAELIEPSPIWRVIADATLEVRSGILYASLLIVLVFVPLFALDGVEGRLFIPLASAYMAAIAASLVVSITLIPVLIRFSLPVTTQLPQEPAWLKRLKVRYTELLQRALAVPRPTFIVVGVLAVIAVVVATQLPRSFLPSFNERTLTVNVLLQPGISLEESNRVGALAETLSLKVPEVLSVGRRTGRAEFDEHAEGIYYSELEMKLRADGRKRAEVVADLRAKLSVLPGTLIFGQPISHRLDHLLSGVKAPLAVKIYGDDLAVLRDIAENVRKRLAEIPGLGDVQVEKQAAVPQLQVRVDPRRAAQYGASVPRVQDALTELTIGRTLSRVIEQERRFDLVLRLPQEKITPNVIGQTLFDTPAGAVPLNWLADIAIAEGPNQILREGQRRRIVVSAYSADGQFDHGAASVPNALKKIPLPAGYELKLEGESLAAQQATVRILQLALVSLLLMLAVLYSRYSSLRLALIVLANVPLAMVGGIFVLAITNTPISIASLIGFVTLAGIAARNGILKVSHYLNLVLAENERFGTALILRGSSERLAPVLMTALIAALALLPLLFSADAPGKEILHPVALVIFGGLVSSTLFDSFLTPLLFHRYGAAPLQRLQQQKQGAALY
ncbi:CusA/CzcA family heavy metal efflux RND transporter [Stenotrophobium rhamnosiphilum]|uniref:CusA/CzcA family heavy metal efflux RND transporter n=1 Tax=Stenotrophobium rhamnosiphilum TaxID=2029166 RepID=A0A2T5MGT3_9GAMM|nr:CusA/CzcA family heavy metal efflux RND transporter [Stenotrophobium rhamnosiphilum]